MSYVATLILFLFPFAALIASLAGPEWYKSGNGHMGLWQVCGGIGDFQICKTFWETDDWFQGLRAMVCGAALFGLLAGFSLLILACRGYDRCLNHLACFMMLLAGLLAMGAAILFGIKYREFESIEIYGWSFWCCAASGVVFFFLSFIFCCCVRKSSDNMV